MSLGQWEQSSEESGWGPRSGENLPRPLQQSKGCFLANPRSRKGEGCVPAGPRKPPSRVTAGHTNTLGCQVHWPGHHSHLPDFPQGWPGPSPTSVASPARSPLLPLLTTTHLQSGIPHPRPSGKFPSPSWPYFKHTCPIFHLWIDTGQGRPRGPPLPCKLTAGILDPVL